MDVFEVLWPYLLTTKLSCLQKNNFGHTTGPSGIGLERVEIENLYPTNNANLKQHPIRPGIFKGYYEPHGIELIAVHYPDESTLKAVKLSGDHNVPMNKVTFTADLKKGKNY